MAIISYGDPKMPSAKELMRGQRLDKAPKFQEFEVPNTSDLEKETEKVLKEFEKEMEKAQEKPEQISFATSLGSYVRSKFDESSNARRDLEQRWLTDLRQYRGQYDPEVLARINPNRSKAFIRMTRTKVKTVDSRLTDFLFPANGDRNWNIDPTPIPDYTKEQMAGVMLEVMGESGVGDPSQLSREAVEQKVFEDAASRAARMAKTIEDQLSELRYRDILREVLHSGNLYGTGVLKGPMVNFKVNNQYVKTPGKTWKLRQKDVIVPQAEAVSIWDMYPDLAVSNIDDCRYIIQRHVMPKSRLAELAKRSDFLGKSIREYLRANPDGDVQRQWYETELRSISDVATSTTHSQPNKNYEVLEFWGYVDCEDLQVAGVRIPEHMAGSLELLANVWTLGDQVIKAALSPIDGVRWPYFFYYYDKDETSVFGEGIASIMRDPQELFNSAFRAMLDHAAITAGPQVEVNLDLLSEDEDPTDLRPFKVWGRTGTGMEAQAEAVRVLQLPSHTGEYLTMIEAFERYSDEVTTIPRYMWGDQAQGAGRTASGLSMMMGSANITIKDQVKNFDDGITKPFITAMYHWNMQFSQDEAIKGDYTIAASGTSSLVAREVYSNSLMNFANITNNPTDQPITKRPKIIRSIAESLDLGDKDLVLSDREIEINRQQMSAEAQKEREFMLRMVETAREYGISPNDMIENMKLTRMDMQQMQQAMPQV